MTNEAKSVWEQMALGWQVGKHKGLWEPFWAWWEDMTSLDRKELLQLGQKVEEQHRRECELLSREPQNILTVQAKCSDLVTLEVNDTVIEGRIPEALGIGHGDYIRFKLDMDTGKIINFQPIDVQAIIEEEENHERNFRIY